MYINSRFRSNFQPYEIFFSTVKNDTVMFVTLRFATLLLELHFFRFLPKTTASHRDVYVPGNRASVQ